LGLRKRDFADEERKFKLQRKVCSLTYAVKYVFFEVGEREEREWREKEKGERERKIQRKRERERKRDGKSEDK
jgi:hypothetical protein